MTRKAAYLTRYHNKAAIYIVLGFLLIFSTVLMVNSSSLKKQIIQLQAEEAKYQQELYTQQQRTLELQELEKTTQTKKYYEQVAREKLGMVYKDEIIFKDK